MVRDSILRLRSDSIIQIKTNEKGIIDTKLAPEISRIWVLDLLT